MNSLYKILCLQTSQEVKKKKLCLEFGLVAAAWQNTFRILFSSQEIKVFRLGDFFLFFVKSVVLRINETTM